jgi:fucose 4-O-acetylase-like acetyltransferase
MSRRTDIDMARGLAILLVVFGHLVARADPAGVEWYEPLRRAVYAFHMPFFLYLSGLTAVLSGAALAPASALPRLAAARAWRLLLPFLLLGGLIVAGKSIAARFMFVDNTPPDLAAGLQALLWHTQASPALSIWYLFVLFWLTLATPLILRQRPSRIGALLAVCLILYALQPPPYAYLDLIARYAVFFGLGIWAGLRGPGWTAFVDRAWPACLGFLLVLLAAVALFGAAWPHRLILLAAGALSMPALHGLVRHWPASSAFILLRLGRYSFMIYLFNTICIGLAKAALLPFTGWNASWFLPVAALLMAAGTLGPVALKRYGLARIPVLDRLTD